MRKSVLLAFGVTLLVIILGCATNVQAENLRVNNEDTYAWVPSGGSNCFLCYEGEETPLKRTAKFDPINPCRSFAKVMKGTCKQYGWRKYISRDPIFRELTLWTNKKEDLVDVTTLYL
jgi:hypothetical protein